jgi:AraC family transcriptional regulator
MSKRDQASRPARWHPGLVNENQGRDQLRQLLDVVVASISEPRLSGAEVAGRAFLSRFHFDRLIAAATGEPPGTLRRRLLLERAAHQLLDGRSQVIAAALAAGYGSAEAFTHAFSRAYGMSPASFRRAGVPPQLPAPNGIHFHPPGGLRLPARKRSTSVDVLTAMLEHDAWLIGQLLDRAVNLDDADLDVPVAVIPRGLEDGTTLRGLLTSLVWQKEHWTAALEGSPAPEPNAAPAGELRSRHAAVAPRYLQLTTSALREGRADETFIDATCEPAVSFTIGGMIAHVLTFAAHRRTLALDALRRAGAGDLEFGDPSGFVAQGGPLAS